MSGLLYKVAADTNTSSVIHDAAKLAGSVGIASVGMVGANKIIGMGEKQIFKTQIPSFIRYAKKKHPELRNVGDEKLKRWVMALYTLSPRMASDKELVADALYQVNEYGGNFDLATSKIVADINRGIKDDNSKYLAAGNSAVGLSIKSGGSSK